MRTDRQPPLLSSFLLQVSVQAQRLETIRRGAIHVVDSMLALDPERLGSRGTHRYSFQKSWAQFGRAEDWAVLIDPPATSAVVEAIFQSADARVAFLGGDFVLPGCVQYQGLHHVRAPHPHHPSTWQRACRRSQDMRDVISPAPGASLSLQDLPAPVVAVSYPMELVEGSPVGHSVVNGAT